MKIKNGLTFTTPKYSSNTVTFLLLLVFSLNLSARQEIQILTPLEQARSFNKDSKNKELLAFVTPLLNEGKFRDQDRLEVLSMVMRAHLAMGNIELSGYINRKMQLEALRAENDLYIGRGLLNEGEIFQRQGLFKEALEKQRLSLTYYRKAKDKTFIANALLEISSSLAHSDNNIEALNFANQSLLLGQEIEDITSIANAYNSIGIIHDNLGNFEKALEAHQKTIQLDRQRGDIDELPTSYFNVASIFLKMQEYEQAEFYALEALKLDTPNANPEHLGMDYSFLANLALQKKEPVRASEFALKAIEYFEINNAKGRIGSVSNTLAKAYFLQDKQALAEKYLKQALQINSEIDNLIQLTQTYMVQIEMLLHQAQISEAIELIEQALISPMKQNYFEHIRALFMLKSQAYEMSGEHEKALAAYKNYYQLKDNFEAENRSNILMQLQNQMDFLYKDHQIQLLESQSSIRQLQLERAKLEKNLWIVGLLLFVCLAAAILYRERTKRHIADIERQLLADSIEQKNSMLAEVAHELRSPLTALKLQVEVLQYNLEDDPAAAFKRLNNKVTELNKLIEDLYDLARADNGLLKLNMESVSVQDLVDDITDGYQEVVEHKGLQLKTDLKVDDTAHFTGDALRIKQVIVNLIRNSINYTDAPGTISCTAKNHDEHCEIILEDSAPGVSTEEIPRLFERMYRADGTRDNHQSGSGLGLSICKSLVEAHKGKIQASSSVLGGLKVRIVLPKSQSTIPDPA